ncbi:MAG: hypothetical protein IJ081_03835 [Prevotella sp.]|nr:hypothetical protein [Prevotella sp.]
MKKVLFHIIRLFRKFWFLLLMTFTISPVIFLIVLFVATIISIALFDDYVEPKNPDDFFTEEELRKIQTGEEVDDEEYLSLLAKYQTFECPVKVDKITTWTSSEVTKDSFICNYEINDRWHRYGEIDMNVVKSNILAQIDKEGYKVQHIIATNRNMIFRYWNRQEGTIEDVVLSIDELKS